MNIEKISNSQIRCILTGEDLASRQLRLSELAYGSEKARALFRDMMEQAAIQCGFDAENYPLMIEAIPLGSDSIVLIVTKVDNPEELDTRFSNFAPSVQKDAAPAKEPPSPLSQLLKSMKENTSDESGSVRTPESRKSAEEALKAEDHAQREASLHGKPHADDQDGGVRDGGKQFRDHAEVLIELGVPDALGIDRGLIARPLLKIAVLCAAGLDRLHQLNAGDGGRGKLARVNMVESLKSIE